MPHLAEELEALCDHAQIGNTGRMREVFSKESCDRQPADAFRMGIDGTENVPFRNDEQPLILDLLACVVGSTPHLLRVLRTVKFPKSSRISRSYLQ